MVRWLAALSFTLAGSVLAGGKSIDLDRPDALDALARENPAHFAKVRRILDEAPKLPLPKMASWMKTQFNAQQVGAPYLLKTSLPAQARISFILDDTRYDAVIRVETPK